MGFKDSKMASANKEPLHDGYFRRNRRREDRLGKNEDRKISEVKI